MKQITIAVDGFSSCGKSTLARELAQSLNYIFIDSGAMYRAVALYFLKNEIPYNGPDASPQLIEDTLNNIDIDFVYNPETKTQQTLLNGENVEGEIRKMYVADQASKISMVSAVRRHLVKKQQEKGLKGGIVMDGRDIGTVVFPNAELKLFMTADPEVRARRRQLELEAKGIKQDLASIQKALEDRDYQDSHREDSPLRKADDAITIDNSKLSKEEQFEMVMKIVEEKIRD